MGDSIVSEEAQYIYIYIYIYIYVTELRFATQNTTGNPFAVTESLPRITGLTPFPYFNFSFQNNNAYATTPYSYTNVIE